MASGIYNIFKSNLMLGHLNLDTDDIRVCLYDGVHSFTASDTNYTTTNELPTTGGYTQGTAVLQNPIVMPGATATFDADDTAWTSATFSADYAVLFDFTYDPVNNNLICCFDFGGTKTVSSGTFTIIWHASGIITLT